MFNLEEQYPLILLFQKMLKLFRWNSFMHLKYIFRRVSALGLSVFCQNIWTIDQKYSFIFIFHLFNIRPYHTVKHLLQAALFWVWSHLRISWKTKVTTMGCFYIEKKSNLCDKCMHFFTTFAQLLANKMESSGNIYKSLVYYHCPFILSCFHVLHNVCCKMIKGIWICEQWHCIGTKYQIWRYSTFNHYKIHHNITELQQKSLKSQTRKINVCVAMDFTKIFSIPSIKIFKQQANNYENEQKLSKHQTQGGLKMSTQILSCATCQYNLHPLIILKVFRGYNPAYFSIHLCPRSVAFLFTCHIR